MSNYLPQAIGIDVSKATLDCHARPAGIDLQFANTAKGHNALIAWVQQWEVERIAYEATGTLAKTDRYSPAWPSRCNRRSSLPGTRSRTNWPNVSTPRRPGA